MGQEDNEEVTLHGQVAGLMIIGYLWMLLMAVLMLASVIQEWWRYGISGVLDLFSDIEYWLTWAVCLVPSVAVIAWARKLGEKPATAEDAD